MTAIACTPSQPTSECFPDQPQCPAVSCVVSVPLSPPRSEANHPEDEPLSNPDEISGPGSDSGSYSDSYSSSTTQVSNPASPASSTTSITPATPLDSGRKRQNEPIPEDGPRKRPKRPSPDPSYRNPFEQLPSAAEERWLWEKANKGANNEAIDQIMKLVGLEEVKEQVLALKAKADIYKHQSADLAKERFNMVFQGNPGTGKTTVARIFPRFLESIGAIQSSTIVETSGTELGYKGPRHVKDVINTMLEDDEGGVLFVDEAYQLTAPHVSTSGRQALDIILTEMENNIGKLVVIFAGYNKDMESFFAHNPGLASRIPYTLQFSDFTDAELWKILSDLIMKKYAGKMEVEGAMDGLYMRIAIRRLARARGVRGFGNARSVENLLQRICDRQVKRLTMEERQGKVPEYLCLTKEDVIGPNPSQAKFRSAAWAKLQELIGLDQVKQSVRVIIDSIELNYERELRELSPFSFSLNRVFTGSPGTGKTTVAKLYGQIMADLGLLSNGEVLVKIPSEFIGDCLGKSEANTKALLQSAVGKVLIIDEAYMLDPGSTMKQPDPYKAGVIDTITAEVQGIPGDDRCILLLGYEDRLKDMFHNVNQGFSRRFDTDNPLHFEDFSLVQLEEILLMKMRQQDVSATETALVIAREMLDRARMHLNFSNAGDVDILLANAKINYQKRQRQQRMPNANWAYGELLEPEDFDPDYGRNERAAASCLHLLRGLVHDGIVAQLDGYYQQVRALKACDINFRQEIPTLFSFNGPSGTGKSTTARMMAKLYYEMGILSSADLIECSATDMIGQYVGQTGPKTKKQLERSLGKTLFVDEASRLNGGVFATEAVSELTYLLRQPRYSGKVIVILAGHPKEMNGLMAAHPTLSALFTEEIMFDSLEPKDCLSLLQRELTEAKIEAPFFAETSPVYPKLVQRFQVLSKFPCWSNASDVKTLAKKLKSVVLGAILEVKERVQAPRILTAKEALQCIDKMIDLKRERQSNQRGEPPDSSTTAGRAERHFPGIPGGADQDVALYFDVTRACPMQTSIETKVKNSVQSAPPLHQTAVPFLNRHLQSSSRILEHASPATFSTPVLNHGGAKREANEASTHTIASLLRKLTDHLPISEENSEERRTETAREMVTDEALKEALAELGTCVYGYSWNKVPGGYRCSGGMHFVSDEQLEEHIRV